MKVTRKQVAAALGELGITNRFTLRTVGFEGTSKQVVNIHDWTPNPIADEIRDRLKKLGVLTTFKPKKGTVFVQ